MQYLKLFFPGVLFLTLKAYGQPPAEVSVYLKSRQVSNSAKDFYNGRFKASDDERTLSIIDSLNTANNTTRPFYIYLVSKMMEKADGALAETLDNSCKQFVENNPDNFVEFLYSENKIVGENFIDYWVQQIADEFKIDCEKNTKYCADEFFQLTLSKCKPDNKALLTDFYKKVETNFK